MIRRSKIVATIGPATSSREKLAALIDVGMDVARLNFSHGSHEGYARVIADVRELSKEQSRPVAILQDLQGIKIRTGPLRGGGPVALSDGQSFTITTQAVEGNEEIVSTSYAQFPEDISTGDEILLSDGLIQLRVKKVSENRVACEVIAGGVLEERQGINIPGATISAPSMTQKDIEDLEFGIEQGVDFVALSFVRRPEDVARLKAKLAELDADLPVIAKLEKPSAIENLDAILDSCEGVMIARGDLGVEMSPERVPVIQKRAIKRANSKNKLVITATQMLESMIDNARPTRAEASDVANAVFDGTDAVMLSGETAVGKYPVESVQMMVRIIIEAEKMSAEYPPEHHDPDRDLPFSEAVCDAAYHASKAIHARAIAAFTQTGATAKLISKYRPRTQILSFTPSQRIAQRTCLYWGVSPIIMREIDNVDELIQECEKLLLQNQIVAPGDNLIILTGAPIVEKGHTSLMKLHKVQAGRRRK